MINKFILISILVICAAIIISLINDNHKRLRISVKRCMKKIANYFKRWIKDDNNRPNNLRLTFPVVIQHSGLIFSPEELILYDGSDDKKDIYVAILGRVYNVTKGSKHYRVGCSYHFFSGRDATRSFVTGDPADADKNLDNLQHQEVLDIINWIRFYDKEYFYIGLVSGLFYDSLGQPSEYLMSFNNSYKAALQWKQEQEENMKTFPSCNSQWNRETGTTFWCSMESGGIKRDWVGVPRKLFNPVTHDWRCVCLHITGPMDARLKALVQEFPDCPSKSISCSFDN